MLHLFLGAILTLGQPGKEERASSLPTPILSSINPMGVGFSDGTAMLPAPGSISVPSEAAPGSVRSSSLRRAMKLTQVDPVINKPMDPVINKPTPPDSPPETISSPPKENGSSDDLW